jgi:uncharacterized alkaline shock family protein YloU
MELQQMARREAQAMAGTAEIESTALVSAQDGATTLQGDRGRTVIATSVVAKIAALAAREVDGVHDLVSTSLGQTVAGLARAAVRQSARDYGVSVEVGQREAAVDVRLICDYGVAVGAVADGVRRNVISRVESLTGLAVKEVNVSIVDLYFPGEPEETAPAPRVQ